MKQHVNYTAAFRDQLNNHLVVDQQSCDMKTVPIAF